jgi:hypothetical protein
VLIQVVVEAVEAELLNQTAMDLPVQIEEGVLSVVGLQLTVVEEAEQQDKVEFPLQVDPVEDQVRL